MKSKETRCPAALMSFLLIGSFIVIGSACCCLALPGVNIIRDVILRGVLPGTFAIALSIPCIIKSVKLGKEKTHIFEKRVFPKVKLILDSPLLDTAPSKIIFIEKNILTAEKPREHQDYYQETLTRALKEYNELKKKKPDLGERCDVRTSAIPDVLTNLIQPTHKPRKTDTK